MSNTDSPLHLAIKNNNIDIAKVILQNRGDVHAVNAEGLTPLQLATPMGNTEMITLLLQNGAGRPSNPTPPIQPTTSPPVSPQTPLNPLWIIGGCVGVALLLMMFLLSGWGGEVGSNQTISEYAQNFSAKINNELAKNSNNGFYKLVESAHVSVKSKQGSVSNCVVETFDGSNLTGHNGSNVSRIRFSVTVYWDGLLHQDGHSVIECVLDVPNNKMISSQIIETDALVNTHDPKLWFSVGILLGEILAAMNE